MTNPIIERVNVFTSSDVEFMDQMVEQFNEDLSKKAHIINPTMNWQLWSRLNDIYGHELSAQDLVDEARRQGLELVSLCQYRWIPTQIITNHDACGACLAIAQSLISDNEG